MKNDGKAQENWQKKVVVIHTKCTKIMKDKIIIEIGLTHHLWEVKQFIENKIFRESCCIGLMLPTTLLIIESHIHYQ